MKQIFHALSEPACPLQGHVRAGTLGQKAGNRPG